MRAAGLAILLTLTVTGGMASAQELRAQLSPRDLTTLAAEIGAKVERITGREGERFKKGETLIAFDCSIQRAQLAEAKAALSAADKTVAVNARLLELQTIGRLESDVAQAERDKARAKLDASVAELVALSRKALTPKRLIFHQPVGL